MKGQVYTLDKVMMKQALYQHLVARRVLMLLLILKRLDELLSKSDEDLVLTQRHEDKKESNPFVTFAAPCEAKGFAVGNRLSGPGFRHRLFIQRRKPNDHGKKD